MNASAAARQSAIRVPQSAVVRRPAGWIDVDRAASLLAKSRRTVQLWCQAGRLTAVRVADPSGAAAWAIDPSSHPTLRMALGPVEAAGEISSLADLTEAKRSVLLARLVAVREYRAAMEARPPERAVRAFTDAWAAAWNARGCRPRVSRTTIEQWARVYKEGGVIALADGRCASPGAESLSPDAWDFLCGLYLVEERPTARACYERALALADREGWTLPTERTIRRRLAALDAKVRAAGRDPRRFRDRCLPYVVRDWSRVAAMEVWVADHRQFDVLWPRCVRDARRRELVWIWHRPWHTLYLDARSWMPASWWIAFDSPNTDRVMGAFVRGVRRHGVPGWLYLDNGKDFRAGRFAGGRPKKRARAVRRVHVEPMLEALGVRAVWAIPYNAKAKVIEPWFRLEGERFDKVWPSYCGGNTQNRPERLARLKDRRALAVRLLGEAEVARIERITGESDRDQARRDEAALSPFKAAFEAWVTDDYALRESPSAAAKPLSPARAFAELRDPAFECVRPPDRDLAMLLLPSRIVGVTTNGLWVPALGSYYWDQALESYRADRRRKVRYRFDPADPSAVYVFDAADGRYLATATPYVGQGVHPLAESGSADAEQLGRAIALTRTTGRTYREGVQAVRGIAADLLASARAGAAAAGLLDAAAPASAATAVIRPVGPDVSRAAADADRRKAKRRRASPDGPDPLDALARAAATAHKNAAAPASPDPLDKIMRYKESANVQSQAG